jgi:tetratricopeptide (TPR) repeat protein
LAVSWLSTRDNTVALTQRYHRSAQQASEAGDSRTAVMLFSRMQELDPESSLATRELAEHYDRLGKTHFATLVMRQLAPASGGGDADAYFWLAKVYFRRPFDPFARRMSRRCLEHALALRPEFPEVDALLGRLAYEEGEHERARTLLQSAAMRAPAFGLDLARVQAALGNLSDARLTAQQIEKLYRETLNGDPTDRPARTRLAEAHLLLGRFPTAVNLLREGLNLEEYAEHRTMLARTYVVWGAGSSEGSDDRWRLWEEAFRTQPDNPDLLRALLAGWGQSQVESTRLTAMLEQVRGDPKVACEANLLLALLAKLQKNALAAKTFVDLAATTPDAPERLARLVHAAPLRADVALQWTALAAGPWPQSGLLRRERAVLLYAARDHRGCLDELERILGDHAEDAIVHAMMAETLERLGDRRRADEHRLLAHPYFSDPTTKGPSS